MDEAAGRFWGAGTVKAFGKVGYEVDEQHGSHIIPCAPSLHIDAFPFSTTGNWPKTLFERGSGKPGSQ